MFNSVIIDVVIGLMFAFLAVSLIASAATESLASVLKWRSNTLRDGIKALMNDPKGTGLAKELYNHALINPRAGGNATSADSVKEKPAYIEPAHFASALLEIVGRTGQAPDKQLQQLLDGMVQRAGGDPQALRAELAGWFDRAMDRVSGAYKRRAQLVTFSLALLIAAALNVDALRIAAHIWERQAIVAQVQPQQSMPAAEAALKQLGELGLPIGWVVAKGSVAPPHAWAGTSDTAWIASFALAFGGWLITAIASLFGAPFWFDSLQQIIRLRGAGPKPGEKPPVPAAGTQPVAGERAPQLAAAGRR